MSETTLGFPGVYAIRCNPTGDLYIGSTSWIGARINEHLKQLLRNSHCNGKLQSAVLAHGIAAMSCALVERCELGKEFEREAAWYGCFNPALNIAPLTVPAEIPAHKKLHFRPLAEMAAESKPAVISVVISPELRDEFFDFCRKQSPRVPMGERLLRCIHSELGKQPPSKAHKPPAKPPPKPRR